MRVIILLFAISIASAENTCPNVEPVNYFDYYKYASGDWYEMGRLENPLEDGTCVVMNSTQEGVGFRLQVSEVVNRTRRVYDGILLNLEQDRGVLDYIFNGYAVVMNVIMTNYTNYAVEYNCWYNETSGEITEQGWIMSRTKDLDNDIKDKIIRFMKDSNITSTDKMIWDDFSEMSCSYDSEDIDTSLPDFIENILEEPQA